MAVFKGANYRSTFFYNSFDFFKLGFGADKRFHLAARGIAAGETVIDFCCGPGRLKDFLPSGCRYTGVDAALNFTNHLQQQGVQTLLCDLHTPEKFPPFKADTVIMLISLCHFRSTSAVRLLTMFKHMARKVIIIEEVQQRPDTRREIRDLLCDVPYYRPMVLFNHLEFQAMTEAQQYTCVVHDQRYSVAYYGLSQQEAHVYNN